MSVASVVGHMAQGIAAASDVTAFLAIPFAASRLPMSEGRTVPCICFLAVVAARLIVAVAVELLARHCLSPGYSQPFTSTPFHRRESATVRLWCRCRGKVKPWPGFAVVACSASNGSVAVAGLWRIVPTYTFGRIRHHRALSLRGLVSLSMAVPPPGCLVMLFCRAKKLCLLPRKVIAVFRFVNVKPAGFCIFFSTPSFFGVVKIRHKLALFLSTPLCRAV